MVFNATFNNISAISWRKPGENHTMGTTTGHCLTRLYWNMNKFCHYTTEILFKVAKTLTLTQNKKNNLKLAVIDFIDKKHCHICPLEIEQCLIATVIQ
jgi:hypothetical protein